MLPAGARLGPYEILAPIGAGGMGELYKARDTRLQREVAVKVLPACAPFFETDPWLEPLRGKERFQDLLMELRTKHEEHGRLYPGGVKG